MFGFLLKKFTQRNRYHKGSRLTFAGGAAFVTTGSFSFSFSGTFRFLFWGNAELDEFATISNLRLFLSKGVPGRGCAGPSSINCWLLSGMKTRKSALRSGASLKSFAIWRETSSCSSAYVSEWLERQKRKKTAPHQLCRTCDDNGRECLKIADTYPDHSVV